MAQVSAASIMGRLCSLLRRASQRKGTFCCAHHEAMISVNVSDDLAVASRAERRLACHLVLLVRGELIVRGPRTSGYLASSNARCARWLASAFRWPGRVRGSAITSSMMPISSSSRRLVVSCFWRQVSEQNFFGRPFSPFQEHQFSHDGLRHRAAVAGCGTQVARASRRSVACTSAGLTPNFLTAVEREVFMGKPFMLRGSWSGSR